MGRIFIMAYARTNLGDDIFIKMLLDKYSNFDFYMKIQDTKHLSNFLKYKNFHILDGQDTDEELYSFSPEDYDAYVYIGGSIFMEGGKVYNLSPKFYDFVKRCKEKNIPFLYISCNYGPYKTKEYFDLSRKNFSVCTDICFRDKYSYNLFKDIETVRYAPDYAFSYDINQKEKIDKSIGISVIDFSIRDDMKEKEEAYLNWLINNINQYIEKGYCVYLYSFCEYEGDERTIDYILKKMNYNNMIKDIRYKGNIDEFLNMYSRMEYFICGRFHSVVLSCISEQKIYVTSYSKKINNIIEDLELGLPICNLHLLDENKLIDLNEFKDVDKNKINSIKIMAKEQDNVLSKKLKDIT